MKNILIIILLFTVSCVQKSYDQEVKFVLDVSALKDIKTVGIRGEASPLSWEKDLPMEVLKKDSLYTITLTGKTGYRFTEVKFVVNGDFELQEKPNRKIIFDSSRKTVYQAKFNVQKKIKQLTKSQSKIGKIMKKSFLVFAIFSLICTTIQAQKGPLLGSGKIVSKEFTIKDFDKLSLEDFDGKIEVEIGKPFSIKIDIDDNLESRLSVSKEEKEGLLIIKLLDNYNGKLYLEKTNIKIKICMPEASAINHRGNTTVKVTGIIGRYFRFENAGNGDVTLTGKTEELDIKKTGNGNVNAQNLTTNTAKVKSFGNGNVAIYAQILLTASGTGNCSVMQFGQGKIEPTSGIIGNGEVKKM